MNLDHLLKSRKAKIVTAGIHGRILRVTILRLTPKSTRVIIQKNEAKLGRNHES